MRTLIDTLLERLRRLLRPAPGSIDETPAARTPESLTPTVLRRITGERVDDLSLYVQAMKHRSLLRGRPADAEESNERLEYLGDAVLGLVAAEHLYVRFREEDEGFLTRMRSKLVNRNALARRAEAAGLGELVLLSENMDQAQGRLNVNILADAFEALIGAVYLDQGYPAARRFVIRSALAPVDMDSLAEREDNFKSLLLEFAQARGWPQPFYRVVGESGPSHEKEFTVQAIVGKRTVGTGVAGSKKRAEQRAAQVALVELEKEDARGDPDRFNQN